MKKKVKITVAILLVFTVFMATKNIIPSKTEYYVTTADLHVRLGAGTKYAISFTLQKGEEVEVVSKIGNWYKIRSLNKTGFVYSEYLKYSKTISNTRDLNTNYQTFQRIIPNIIIVVFALVILFFTFIIFRKVRDKKLLKTVTKPSRGTHSERDLVLKLLKHGIPAEMIFHDLFLQKDNGDFSQTDLAVITEVGIIVFEVKDYSGWIFGSGNQSQWTKVLAYGKQKYRFYNPIMQNNKHIEELRKSLGQIENVPFYSIVVFYGNCVLKEINFVPNGTFLVKSNSVLEVMKMIVENNEFAQYEHKDKVAHILKEAVMNGDNTEIQNQHIERIQDMLGKDRIFE